MKNMKKLSLLFIITVIALFCLTVSVSAQASEWKKVEENHRVEYNFDAETGIFRVKGEGYVPAYYFGYLHSTPTDEEEFFDMEDENYNSISEIAADVKILIIEKGITATSRYSFSNLKNLETVILPQSLAEIGYASFNYCENLRNIVLPGSLETIKAYAFSYCKSLSNISFPSSLKKIDYHAFRGAGIETIYIPKNVEYLGYDIFKGCDNLKKITFTKLMIEMSNCDALEEIVCPTDITESSWCLSDDGNPYRIAKNCKNLKKVIFPSYEKENNIKISVDSYDKFVKDCPNVNLGYVNYDFIKNTDVDHALITNTISKISKVTDFIHTQKGNTNKLTWSPVDGAGYYKLYYWNGKEWERVYCGSATTFKNPVEGKYRVRAVNYNGEKYVYGKYTNIEVDIVDSVSFESVKTSGRNVTLKWKKISNVTGYQVYYSTKEGSGYKKLVTTSKNSYTVKNLEKGKPYYFKVRAYYKPSSGTTKYGVFSNISSATI